MNCKKAKILISAALDGELSSREEQGLERHLACCACCAHERAQVSALSQNMSLWMDEEPSEWLAQSFAYKLADLEKEPVRVPRRRSRWLRAAVPTALAAAVLAVGLFLHNPAPESVSVATGPGPGPIVASTPTSNEPPVVKQTGSTKKPPAATNKTGNGIRNTDKKIRKGTMRKPIRERIPIYRPRDNHERLANAFPEDRGYRPGTYKELISRGPALTKKQKEALITQNILAARDAKKDAATVIAESLGEASVAMDETLESVRGTLRKTADILSAGTPVQADDRIDSHGGK